MKLLITTQAVDIDDPVLGFFHGWLVEFSKYFETIHVVCLKEGRHDLPKNIQVHTLGKESGISRFKYVSLFYRYIWQYRKDYDVVFSHMNPHYIVLAGWLWSLLGKRIFFWRNHAKMNLQTYVAAFFARNVFYTSPYACTARFKHAVKMPVGINTQIFEPIEEVERKNRSVLFLGRLSRVKRPELFMSSVAVLPHDIQVDVYGDAGAGNKEYLDTLKKQSMGRAHFHGAISNDQTPAIYNASELYVNLTPEGSMDKTILEAASCGCLVLVANRSFEGEIPDRYIFHGEDKLELAKRIEMLLSLPNEVKKRDIVELRSLVVDKHSLGKLAKNLSTIFAS